MLMTRGIVAPLLALGLVVPPLARAHIAEFEATLDTAQEVPAPVGTNPGAGGSGTFVLEDDGTVEATVTYQGLTAAPTFAHIHEGAPGVPGPVRSDFSSSLPGGTAGTIAGTGSVPLSEALQQAMFAGGLYFNIHTPENGGGEIRGQIRLKQGVCSCAPPETPASFKRCVKQALRNVEKAERREESVKTLRKLVAKSACGKTKPAARKRVACCLPFAPAQNIVTDRMCATLKAKQCDRLGGTSPGGTGIACSPNPCAVGSPSGAFIGDPAAS